MLHKLKSSARPLEKLGVLAANLHNELQHAFADGDGVVRKRFPSDAIEDA